jgi:hypothetical protein
MAKHSIIINDCHHYLIKDSNDKRVNLVDSSILSTIDHSIDHPLGTVYKAKTVIDSNFRIVRQKDDSLLAFNKVEWELNQKKKHQSNFFLKLIKNLFT